jgi:hypothetical protein
MLHILSTCLDRGYPKVSPDRYADLMKLSSGLSIHLDVNSSQALRRKILLAVVRENFFLIYRSVKADEHLLVMAIKQGVDVVNLFFP